MSEGLTAIANKYGSDKGDTVRHAHHYTKVYEFLFEAWRSDAFSMLELGLQWGDWFASTNAVAGRSVSDIPSVRMWLEYFERARVFGFDISDFGGLVIDRFTFVRGDAGSVADLERLAKGLPPLRLIVDDASHAAFHQQLTFAKLFPT